MKKLLNLLGTGVILMSSFLIGNIPRISQSLYQVSELRREIRLAVNPILQDTDYFCVPASIEAVFRHFQLDSDWYTQDRIYYDLRRIDPNPPERGVYVDQYVADYMNRSINEPGTGHNVQYYYNYLGFHAGAAVETLTLFQNYVFNSLSNNYPVLLGYDYDTIEIWGHVVVIIGMSIDEYDPWETMYTIMDPEGARIFNLSGSALTDLIRVDSEVIGFGDINDFDRDSMQITIKNQEGNEDHLADYDVHKAAEINVDLTQTARSTTTGSFRKAFQQVYLDEFNGEIYNFTWRKPVTDLHLSTENIPDDNDNWKSKLIEIDRTHQWSDNAYIEGILSAQLSFSRSSLDHLILHLAIYVAGVSWNTGNWAHIWFMTGTILSLIKKDNQ